MNNSKGFTLVELMIVVVILAVLISISIPNFIKLQDRAKEAKVTGGGHTLQLAAEDFAVRNDGFYSDAAGDVGPLLPSDPNGGNNLENAFTRAYSEPVWAAAAALSGEIGITAVQDGAGSNVGYEITGFGRKELILELSSGN